MKTIKEMLKPFILKNTFGRFLYDRYRNIKHFIHLERGVFRVNTKQKKIALTFDATYGNTYTSNLISIFQKYHIHVTFFISGIWAEKFPNDLKKINDCGYEIGNHSYNHPHMRDLDEKEAIKQIELTDKLITDITGKQVNLFRFPFGETNKKLGNLVYHSKHLPIYWTVDSLDWEENISTQQIYERIKDVNKGSIILMHNGGKHTAEVLEKLIPELQQKGYEFVTISELLKSSFTGRLLLKHFYNKIK